MQQVFRSNHIYKLLIFIPFGIIFGAIGVNPTVVFVLNMLAIIPLAMLLSFATEELSENAGQTIGALLNATFGNAVEMIVCCYPSLTVPEKLCADIIQVSTVALQKGEIRIVQSSMLGAILSNVLLVHDPIIPQNFQRINVVTGTWLLSIHWRLPPRLLLQCHSSTNHVLTLGRCFGIFNDSHRPKLCLQWP